jgi:hypothetical protein
MNLHDFGFIQGVCATLFVAGAYVLIVGGNNGRHARNGKDGKFELPMEACGICNHGDCGTCPHEARIIAEKEVK